MSYRTYNSRNRNAGRHRNTGQFVSSAEMAVQSAAAMNLMPPPPVPAPVPVGNGSGGNSEPHSTSTSTTTYTEICSADVKPQEDSKTAMQIEEVSEVVERAERIRIRNKHRYSGVRKMTKTERRRRQNNHLRRLITPKNALTVLNEMLQAENMESSLKVKQTAPFSDKAYCADFKIAGSSYKGYGANTLIARNAAAEVAVKDLIIKKMNKCFYPDDWNEEGGGSAGGDAGGGDSEPLPMLQLASYALHKLYCEWEYEGYKLPQGTAQSYESIEAAKAWVEASAAAGEEEGAGEAEDEDEGWDADVDVDAAAMPRPVRVHAPPPAPMRRTKPMRAAPSNAAKLHPCMLLTYVRACAVYRDVTPPGPPPGPPGMQPPRSFTIAVDIDGKTWTATASNKKEARRLAAKAACEELYGVQFDPVPSTNLPQP